MSNLYIQAITTCGCCVYTEISLPEDFDYIDSKNISKSVADYLKMKITVLVAANGYLPSYSCKMFGFKRSRRYNGGTDM